MAAVNLLLGPVICFLSAGRGLEAARNSGSAIFLRVVRFSGAIFGYPCPIFPKEDIQTPVQPVFYRPMPSIPYSSRAFISLLLIAGLLSHLLCNPHEKQRRVQTDKKQSPW
jgi:hypothetical protein